MRIRIRGSPLYSMNFICAFVTITMFYLDSNPYHVPDVGCTMCDNQALFGRVCMEHFTQKMSRKYISKGPGELHVRDLLSEYDKYNRWYADRLNLIEKNQISKILHNLYHGKFTPIEAIEYHNNFLEMNVSENVEKIPIQRYARIKCILSHCEKTSEEYKLLPLSSHTDAVCSDCEGICQGGGEECKEEFGELDVYTDKFGISRLLCEACLDKAYEWDFPDHEKPQNMVNLGGPSVYGHSSIWRDYDDYNMFKHSHDDEYD